MNARPWVLTLPIFLLTMTSLDSRRQSSTTPVDRLSEEWWSRRHATAVRMTEFGRADVVFLGDSITQGWEGAGEQVWLTQVAPYRAMNFGFGGDRTEHVLWRLRNGELIGLRPRVVVVMIGTDNIGTGQSPEETADGVRTVVNEINRRLPTSKVILLGLFPRGKTVDDPLRRNAKKATELFRACADGDRVRFHDIGGIFLRHGGALREALMPDLLHPNAAGYEVWAKAVTPLLDRALPEVK